MAASPGSAEGRYIQLEANRSPFLQRARECSKFTIPHLVPPTTGTTGKIKTTFQGVGARGVNNLSSKMLLTLFPPNAPLFRYDVDEMVLEKEKQSEFKTEIDKALAKIERAVTKEIEVSADRVAVFEALKHIIVAGNVLLYVGKDGTRVYHLTRYVLKRDAMGHVLEIVTTESVSPSALPAEFLKHIQNSDKWDKQSDEKEVTIYTHIRRKGDQWVWDQEVCGKKIPGTQGNSPLESSPWIPLRFHRIDGEDYGRAYVEEFLGDLKSLEALTQAIVEGSAAAAKVLMLVDPNGTTRAKTVAEAPNGAVREGNANDVTVLQMEKHGDFSTALQTMSRIEQRLEASFLLNSSVQRRGERVTAEEIRYMAGELEDALGGVYSILSQEFQLPYIRRRIAIMQRDGRIPKLPKHLVAPSIVTGLEALGRGHDRNKLVSFITTLGQALGPEVISRFVNVEEAIARLAVSDGIDPQGLIKTKEEIQADQQQAQMMAMAQQLGPHAIKAMTQPQPQGAPSAQGSPQ